MKKTIAIVITGILMCMCLCACSGGTQNATKSAMISSSSSGEEPTVIASSSKNYVGKQILLEMTNATGYEIVSMIVKNSDNDAEVGLIKKGKTFKNWETREFIYSMDEEISSDTELDKTGETLSEEATEITTNPTAEINPNLINTSTEIETPAEKLLPAEYSIEVTLENDETFTLHAFPMEDTIRMIIAYEGGYGYLIYESLSTETMVNTSEAEKTLSEAQTVTDTYSNNNYGYDYNYNYNYNYNYSYQEPVYQAPAYQEPAPQTGGEGCLDGGLFW